MPLICLKDIDHNTRLGLWKICEEESLEDFFPPAVRPLTHKLCTVRRIEKAAVYAILKAMTGRQDLLIRHEPSGKPFIEKDNGDAYKCYISISHTHGYACLIMSESRPVAIDIEYYSNRVSRITERFMNNDELEECTANDNGMILIRQIIYWCAKETAYKLYSDQKLTFSQIHISDIGHTIEEKGELKCQNIINGKTSILKYWQNKDFVMTYR